VNLKVECELSACDSAEQERQKIWNKYWEDGDLQWKTKDAYPSLRKHFHELIRFPDPTYKVLGAFRLRCILHVSTVRTPFSAVPLCGDSVDLSFLASTGVTVLGVELIESAVKKIEMDIEDCSLHDSGKTSGGCIPAFSR
jgi:hypothetical protein